MPRCDLLIEHRPWVLHPLYGLLHGQGHLLLAAGVVDGSSHRFATIVVSHSRGGRFMVTVCVLCTSSAILFTQCVQCSNVYILYSVSSVPTCKLVLVYGVYTVQCQVCTLYSVKCGQLEDLFPLYLQLLLHRMEIYMHGSNYREIQFP